MNPRSILSVPGFRGTLCAFVFSRLLILAIGYLSTGIILVAPEQAKHGFIAPFLRWDSNWYLELARHGYEFIPNDQSNVVFFPLYPLLMHVGSLGVLSLTHGGLLVSNLCTFGAAMLIWHLARIDHTERTADMAVRFFLFGPVSFFFSTIYSEGTFVLFVAASLFGARTRRWWLAGAAGYAAALTRSVGLLMVIPLAMEFLAQERKDFSWRNLGCWIRLACTGLPAAGTLTYMAYMAMKFGDPLVYRKAEIFWGRKLMPFWETFLHPNVASLPDVYKAWFIGALILAAVLIGAGLLLRIRGAYLAMAAAYVVLYTSTGVLEAIPRYMSVIVPFYIILGAWVERRPFLELPFTILSTALLAFSTVAFSTGYWFT
ncbi:MAG: hypothetical protein HS122_10210 [Opitutaceae bacterium]|nr:hypothetical protein [Opitutaceae bacterium]